MRRRIWVAAVLIMTVTLLAGCFTCAHAAPGTSILMLGSQFSDRDKVWMGNISTTTASGSYTGPLPWIVLDGANAYDGVTEGATILSECAYITGPFSTFKVDDWAVSTLRTRMQTFLADSSHFTDAERALFMPMTVPSSADGRDALSNETIYALANADVTGAAPRYLKTAADRMSRDITIASGTYAYWLRSSTLVVNDAIDALGIWTDLFNYTNPLCMRPAGSLTYQRIGMISSVGGKASGAGSLAKNNTAATGEYTLTVLDSTLSVTISTASVTATTAGGTVSVPYANASFGPDHYLSAIITQGATDSDVLYYGRLRQVANLADATGTLSVTIPAGLSAGGGYRLRMFSELYNGGASGTSKQTDYMSAMHLITLSITRTSVPDTGDRQQPLLWLGLTAASAVGLAILLLRRKRAPAHR